MTRAEWQRIADERVRDANVLLSAKRWAAAYYLAGYAVESALKACIVVYVKKNAEVVFREKKYSEKCWTHDIEILLQLAGLKETRDADASLNPALLKSWQVVKDWSEITRYERRTRLDAEKLYEAVTQTAVGVLPWIKNHW